MTGCRIKMITWVVSALTLVLSSVPVVAQETKSAKLNILEMLLWSAKSVAFVQEGERHYQAGRVGESAAAFRSGSEAFRRMSEGEENSPLIMSHQLAGFANALLGNNEQALAEYRKALAVSRRVYRQRDHNELALSLERVAEQLVELGRPSEAVDLAEQALEMRRRMAGTADDPSLVESHHTMGTLFRSLCDYERSLWHYERVLDINRQLAGGKDDSVYAESLTNVGVTLHSLGETEKALEYLRKGLAMHERLARGRDTVDVALGLMNIGAILKQAGRSDESLGYAVRARETLDRLYESRDNSRFAMALANEASSLDALGRIAEAIAAMDRAAAMADRLYAGGDHPERMLYLNNQGVMRAKAGEVEKALSYYEAALVMLVRLSESLAQGASDVGALEFLTYAPARDNYLTATVSSPETSVRVYRHVWNVKAAFTRFEQRRAEAARLAAADDPHVREKWEQLQAVRQELSWLLLASPTTVEDREQRLRELTDRKERRQREFAALLPSTWDVSGPVSYDAGPNRLADHLPPDSVFIDLIYYRNTKDDDPVPRYCAFVVAPDQTPLRVELGDADTVGSAVRDWRRSLQAGVRAGSAAGSRLRTLVWDPIARKLPSATRIVYLSVDHDLSLIPFAALPGAGSESILLEQYAFGYVMHGPYLLEQLLHAEDSVAKVNKVVAVGGARYDSPDSGEESDYPYLEGTEREQDQVLLMAGDRPTAALRGREATINHLAQALSNARYAHLATHGFFAEHRLESERDRMARRLEEWNFNPGQSTTRTGLEAQFK